VCFVPSEWQLADIPTKPVGGVIFNHLIAMTIHKGITTVETIRTCAGSAQDPGSRGVTEVNGNELENEEKRNGEEPHGRERGVS
jgi:hypothetical protein